MTATIVEKVELYYQEGKSDKVYHVFLEKHAKWWAVRYAYGRRGSKLAEGYKIEGVSEAVARKAFNLLSQEKLGKGYQLQLTVDATGEATTPALTLKLVPMQLDEVENLGQLQALVEADGWVAQPKYDGTRKLFGTQFGKAVAFNKSGKVVAFPAELAGRVAALGADTLVDGEFIAGQFYPFDLLFWKGVDLRGKPYSERLPLLAEACAATGWPMIQTAVTTEQKQRLLASLVAHGAEGVVFKRENERYVAGRSPFAKKYKFYHTATVRVARVNVKRSVAMEMLHKGAKWVGVGDVSIPVNKEIPEAGQLVEVRYLYAFEDTNALFQPVYQGVRDDVEVEEAALSQLKYKAAAPVPVVVLPPTPQAAPPADVVVYACQQLKVTPPAPSTQAYALLTQLLTELGVKA